MVNVLRKIDLINLCFKAKCQQSFLRLYYAVLCLYMLGISKITKLFSENMNIFTKHNLPSTLGINPVSIKHLMHIINSRFIIFIS